MTTTEEFATTADVTVSVDLTTLLRASRLVGYDYNDQPVHSDSLRTEIIAAAARQVTGQVLDVELKKAIGEEIQRQVAAGVQAALDAEVRPTNEWGEPKGEAKTLRQALTDQAAEQVRKWMKAGDRHSGNEFEKFLQREVDQAVRADLNGALKDARAEVKARIEARAAEAIAEAATAAVRGMK